MDTLRLLVTSDTHGGMPSYSSNECFLPRLASSLVRARKGVRSILLDNGDVFYGSPLADYLAEGLVENHSIAQFYSSLGYDGINIGNEDLRFGLDKLQALGRRYTLPFLSTNLRIRGNSPISRSQTISIRLQSGTMLKVGVVGCVPLTACHGVRESIFRSPYRTIAAEVAMLRHSGCHLIVALCHTGVSGGSGFPPEEADALSLASIPGISVVVAGHLHEVCAMRAAEGTLIVAPGCFGQQFGLVELQVRSNRSGVLEVIPQAYGVEETREAVPDSSYERLLRTDLELSSTLQDTVIDHRVGSLSTAFAPLIKPSAVSWMEESLQQFVISSTQQDDHIIVTECPGGRGPLPWYTIAGGSVTNRDLAMIFPYDNTLHSVEVPGATLLTWIEESMAIFNRVDGDSIGRQPLLNETIPLCDHDYFSDMTFSMNLDKDVGGRISDVKWRGESICSRRIYRAVINSYRLARLTSSGYRLRSRTIAGCVRTVLRGRLRCGINLAPRSLRVVPPAGIRSQLFFRAVSETKESVPKGVLQVVSSDVALDGTAVYALGTRGDLLCQWD